MEFNSGRGLRPCYEPLGCLAHEMNRLSYQVRFSFGRLYLATDPLDKEPDIGQPRRKDHLRNKKRRPTAPILIFISDVLFAPFNHLLAEGHTIFIRSPIPIFYSDLSFRILIHFVKSDCFDRPYNAQVNGKTGRRDLCVKTNMF